jgi:hypothetical protein
MSKIRSGYTQCACRDCFEITISSDVRKPELCSDGEAAGCDGGECQVLPDLCPACTEAECDGDCEMAREAL